MTVSNAAQMKIQHRYSIPNLISSTLFCHILIILATAPQATLEMQGIIMQCPTNQSYDSHLQACCTECAKGSGVALPCKAGNDTVCEPCRDGVEFSSLVSHRKSCDACYKCPSNSYELHKCNATHNTRCRCQPGYHGVMIDKEKFRCKMCSKCPAGQYTVRACDHHRDTVCAPCAPDTHSPTLGADECKPCRKCPNGAMAKQCTAEMDTICEGSPFVPSNGVKNSNPSIGPTSYDRNTVNLVPVYCTVLASIFLGLVIYVILKRLKCCKTVDAKQSAAEMQKGKNGLACLSTSSSNQPVHLHQTNELRHSYASGGGSAFVAVPCGDPDSYKQPVMHKNRTAYSPLKNSQSTTSQPLMTAQPESQQRLLYPIPNSQSTNTKSQLTDCLNSAPTSGRLDADCLSKLESEIAGRAAIDGRKELWMVIGKKLGYKDPYLSQVRDRALITGQPPVRVLLTKWNESEAFNVTRLIQIFQQLRMSNLVEIVCQSSNRVVDI